MILSGCKKSIPHQFTLVTYQSNSRCSTKNDLVLKTISYHYQCQKSIFVETVIHFMFKDSLMNRKEQHLFIIDYKCKSLYC